MEPKVDERVGSYESTIQLLTARGLDEVAVRQGSLPEAHLGFIKNIVVERLNARPLHGLHVGNYLGVSLASFALALRDCHPDSVTVAVDPNVTTNGIANPAEHVVAVLERFGLLSSVLLVTGYSFAPTESWADPEDAPAASGENVLPQLARLGVRFDVALIDGNHTATTVNRELEWLRSNLNPGAVVFLDDVTDAWPAIRDSYQRWVGSDFASVGHDGRVGALQFLSG